MLSYMTHEQVDALAGKLVFEYASLGKEIGVLDAEAKRLGRSFGTAAQALDSHPENLIFDKQSHDARFNGPIVKVEDLDGQHILKLTNEIREKMARRQDIGTQLKNMGLDLPK